MEKNTSISEDTEKEVAEETKISQGGGRKARRTPVRDKYVSLGRTARRCRGRSCGGDRGGP